MEPPTRGRRNPDFLLNWGKINRASTYIHGVDSITPGTLVWLWCRVSTKRQFERKNHLSQEAAMRAAVVERGGKVVGRTHCHEPWDVAEAHLHKAAREAERAGAVLLAAVTSRFVRDPFFSTVKDPTREPGEKDRRELKAGFEELSGLRYPCGPVRLVTLLDPDATNEEENAFLSAIGKKYKVFTDGRPPKPAPTPKNEPGSTKKRREENKEEVLRLHGEGIANREIERRLGIPESTVRLWVRSFLADSEGNQDG